MAHIALAMVTKLPLHTARRQPQCHVRVILHNDYHLDNRYALGRQYICIGCYCFGGNRIATVCSLSERATSENHPQPQYDEYDATWWTVARSLVELYHLGRTERHRYAGIQILAKQKYICQIIVAYGGGSIGGRVVKVFGVSDSQDSLRLACSAVVRHICETYL